MKNIKTKEMIEIRAMQKRIGRFFRTAVMGMAAALVFTACEVETTSVLFEEDHNFSHPNDTVFSMLGILGKVQQVAERGVLLGELRGDLVRVDPELLRPHSEVLADLAQFRNLEDTTFNRYRDYYAIVNNCNFYLSRADAEMERRGEKVFLKEYAAVSAWRAWAYLQLVLLYEEVPFYTQPLLSYSEIDRVMNDPSCRKRITDVCSYFIEDLKRYVDVPYPDYGSFTYRENATINCKEFFLPVRLLLGDLYLWRGSQTGNNNDFAQAAQCYRDYLVKEPNMMLGANSGRVYEVPDMDAPKVSGSWLPTGSNERISLIPLACNAEYGKVGALYDAFMGFVGSESLQQLVDGSYYCFVMYTREGDQTGQYTSRFTGMVEDTRYEGTPEHPRYYHYIGVEGTPQYFMGDLRFYGTSRYSDHMLNINKYSSSWPHVQTYRKGQVYLRLAEAINRAGYPLTAFHVLKYGLNHGNLLQYDANGEYERLRASGYTFYNMGGYEDITAMGDRDFNIGIHARGCGNAEMDELHYSLPQMATRADSIICVEDLICDELALETAYEGQRFFDLMRFAFRRGDDYLATRVASRTAPGQPDPELYALLKERRNWYLPMVEN